MTTCRVCGCDDDHACIGAFGPCHWIEPNLCSECAPPLEEPQSPTFNPTNNQ